MSADTKLVGGGGGSTGAPLESKIMVSYGPPVLALFVPVLAFPFPLVRALLFLLLLLLLLLSRMLSVEVVLVREMD